MKTTAEKRLILLLCLVLACLSLSGCRSSEARDADAVLAALDPAAPEPEAVASARETYEALSAKERSSLENAETLLEAEAALRAREVDDLIAAIGEITLQSGEAIAAAREAYDALDEEAAAKVCSLSVLTEAETELHRLTVADAAAKIDALIDGIGEVTLQSGEAIAAAKEALAAADGEVAAAVKGAAALEIAEEALRRLELESSAADFDARVAALGEITLESDEAVHALRAEYEALDAPVRARVTALPALEEAEATLTYLAGKARAEDLDARVAALGTVTLDKEDDVAALRREYAALPAEIKALSSSAAALDKAEAALAALHDKASAAEIQKLCRAKDYDGAIACAEKAMAGRELSEVGSGVVKACLNACAAKADALMKQGKNEEAYEFLTDCRETYAGADLSALNKSFTALNKAIAEPKNGQTFSTSARGSRCPLRIRNNGAPMFLKVVSTTDPGSFLTFYVREKQTVTVKVKAGTYEIRTAQGDRWFGAKELFGRDTRYSRMDDTFRFAGSSGWQIEIGVANGNLGSTDIIDDEF